MLSQKFTERHFQMIEFTVACILLLLQVTGKRSCLIVQTPFNCLLYQILKIIENYWFHWWNSYKTILHVCVCTCIRCNPIYHIYVAFHTVIFVMHYFFIIVIRKNLICIYFQHTFTFATTKLVCSRECKSVLKVNANKVFPYHYDVE